MPQITLSKILLFFYILRYEGLSTAFSRLKNISRKKAIPILKYRVKEIKQNEKILLMIDQHIPMYDHDAGSRAVFNYITFFLHYGYKVYFIGNDFQKHEPYYTKLNNLGIEILSGRYYYYNWKSWYKKNISYINLVILNKPNVASYFLKYIKKNNINKIIYFGHDLHYLREKREYDLTNKKWLLASSKRWEKQEIKIIENVDASYWFSNIEVNIIKKNKIHVNAKAIPINIFYDVVKRQNLINQCNNLLFVGGFSHRPNIDAMIWFCNDIMPIVISKLPNIILYIVGSNTPKEINELNSDNIIVKGYVPDEELERIYNYTKVAVIPLRFGAGIKGKIIEAMYYQIPIITTSIGIEGIHNTESFVFVEDNPVNFANKIIELYYDHEKLNYMCNCSYSYIKNNFSENNVLKIFKEDNII